MIFPSYDLLVADIHQAIDKKDMERLKDLYPHFEEQKCENMTEEVYAKHVELLEEVKKIILP